MANADNTRFMQDLGTGDNRALALKLYAGTVKATFDASTPLWNMSEKMTITQGNSYQFPFVGDADGGEHEPGTERTGNTKPLTEERTVPVDNKEIEAHNWLTKVDENVAHFEVAGRYGQKHGAYLANYLESRAARMICLGARQAATGTDSDFPSGILVHRDAASVTAGYPLSALGSRNAQDDLGEAMQGIAERDIPEGMVPTMLVSPYLYRVLLRDNSLTSSDFLLNPATNNKVTAIVQMVEGWRIVKSTILPQYTKATGKPGRAIQGAGAAVTGGEAAYRGNFTYTAAIGVAAPDALGIVQFGGIDSAGPTWDENRRSSFLSSAWHGGVKWLRREACVEIYCKSSTGYTLSNGVYAP